MRTVFEAPEPDFPTEVPVEPVPDNGLAIEPDAGEKLLRLANHVGDLTFAMDATGLAELGMRVVEDYEADKVDRKEWEDIAKESLRKASQEGECEEKDGGVWKGSSNVQYPLITVGALQFAARAYPAIVKGDEAVSVKTVGADKGRPQIDPNTGQPAMVQGPDGQPQPAWAVPPGGKAARAMRVRDYLNTQIFYRIDDWESDTDALLLQLPIVGCAFRKVWYDADRGKQCSSLVPALRLIAPMASKSCKTAIRLTEEVPDVSPLDILHRIRSEFYRLVDFGKWDEFDNKPRLLLEQHRWIDLDEDGLPEPYVVTVDHETREVLRIEANYSADSIVWNGGKVLRIERGEFYVKFDFFPHPEGKFYGVGLGHMLRQIGAVVDTAINQMIDAGKAQVAGGGFVASGVRLTNSRRTGNLRFEPGEYKTIDVPGDQLRNAIVERTFPGPSQIMYSVLELMLGAATDISSVKDVVTGEASNNGQVGTTLALIEQGLAQFTAIYKRIYRSLKEEFSLLFGNIARFGGEAAAKDYREVLDDERADFAADFNVSDLDIRPVSDPTSVTKMQKMARAQFLMGFVGAPGVDPQAIMRRAFEAADVDDADELFVPIAPPPPNPKDVADAQAKEAQAFKDTMQGEHTAVETERMKLATLAEAFGAGKMMALA